MTRRIHFPHPFYTIYNLQRNIFINVIALSITGKFNLVLWFPWDYILYPKESLRASGFFGDIFCIQNKL